MSMTSQGLSRRERTTRNAMQGVFVLAGIALIIAGFNGARPLVFVGAGLIALAVVGRLLGGGRQGGDQMPEPRTKDRPRGDSR